MKTQVILHAKKWQGNEQCNHANQKYMAEGFSLVPQGKFWIDLINSIVWRTYTNTKKIRSLWLLFVVGVISLEK